MMSPLRPPLATMGLMLLQPRAYVGCDWCPVKIMLGELGSDLCFWFTHCCKLISQMKISWWSECEAMILLFRGQHLKLFISPGWISIFVTFSFDCYPCPYCWYAFGPPWAPPPAGPYLLPPPISMVILLLLACSL